MKVEINLTNQDIEAIANLVCERLKPLLNGGKQDKDVIFDIQGLCDYLGVSRQWIYERTHLKEIPHIKASGLLRFKKSDIDKWLNTFHIPAIKR